MTEETIEKAKHDADRIAPLAAVAEAEYRNLVRDEKIVISKLILKHKDSAKNIEILKALAHTDPEYRVHKEGIDSAQMRYLKANKAYEAIIEWMRLATSWNYKENSRFKAGA